MVDHATVLETAKKAAYEAGKIILTAVPLNVVEKSLSDYVTDVDYKCQNQIKDIIKNTFPDHNFLAEEDGQSFESKNNLWIIDPLDGTTNFIHDLKHSAVSIAFYSGNEIKTGVIYDPYNDEMFYAEKGKGAYLNGKKISVSVQADAGRSLVATGMPFRKHDKIPKYFECMAEVLRNSSCLRRMGSASLDLAYTACGRFEMFFEGWLSPWDIAAGIIIVEEAGGTVCDFRGEKKYFEHGCVIASSGSAHEHFFKIINNFLKDDQ